MNPLPNLLPEIKSRIRTYLCKLAIYDEWCLIVTQLRDSYATEIYYSSKQIQLPQDLYERDFRWLGDLREIYWFGGRIAMFRSACAFEYKKGGQTMIYTPLNIYIVYKKEEEATENEYCKYIKTLRETVKGSNTNVEFQ